MRNQRLKKEQKGGGSFVGWELCVLRATAHLSSGKQIIRAMWLQSSKDYLQVHSALLLIMLAGT